MPDTKATYIWFNAHGRGRSHFAMFRRTFTLKHPVERAVLHLFADTVYQLFVNGRFLEFGPVRFDPRFPQYDTVDLAPHLSAGSNVVAVLVKSYDHKTFKSISSRGGFIAWGEALTTKGENIDLATGQAPWKARRMEALSRYTPKISFALDNADLFDQALYEEGWTEAAYDDADWPDAVPLDRQDHWGPLEPRSIPSMSGERIQPHKLLHIAPLENRYDYYSCMIPLPHQDEQKNPDYSKLAAIRTWIYSPEDQTVSAKVFWARGYLNGELLPDGIDADGRVLQQVQPWSLKKGWNRYFFRGEAQRDGYDFYIGLPRNRGLKMSAVRDETDPARFEHTRELTAAEAEALNELPAPFAEDETLEAVGGWQTSHRDAPADNPCREASWDEYAPPIETLSASRLEGHTFRKEDYPEGFMVLIDLAHMHLVIPYLELEGVNGARVDLTYSERVLPDDRYLLHMFMYYAGDRAVCARDRLDWLITEPRGTRYIKWTVRNAPGDVTLKRFHLRSAHYPVERIGRFHCSDPALNAIWDLGAHTEAANMEDAYVDCIGRERGMYGRDTITQYRINLAVFGDHALMGRCLQLYGQSALDDGRFQCVYPIPGHYFISDFALEMVNGYWDYFRFSGDLDRLRDDWPIILRNLDWFHELSDEREDGLLSADWPKTRNVFSRYGGFHGDNSAPPDFFARNGVNGTFTCFYLRAMNAAAAIAERLDDHAPYESLQTRIQRVRQSVRATYWNETKQCYADTLDHDQFSPQVNIMAVLAGAVSDDQLDGIRRHIGETLPGPFFNGYDPSAGVRFGPAYAVFLFEGLYRLGLYDVAERLMHEGWGWMLSRGFPHTPEFFNEGDFSSMCHAWSASPTYYLSRHVLGVHFPEPGNMDVIRLSVQTHSVDWAEGVFPHPRGAIRVGWRRDGNEIAWDPVHTPPGVTVWTD